MLTIEWDIVPHNPFYRRTSFWRSFLQFDKLKVNFSSVKFSPEPGTRIDIVGLLTELRKICVFVILNAEDTKRYKSTPGSRW